MNIQDGAPVMTEPLRYPIGTFDLASPVTPKQRRAAIAAIAALPEELATAVRGVAEEHIDTPYRAGGWTVRQVVHHLADSHMNAYVRCKLALTEDTPTIKPYDEARWGELTDARTAPVDVSLMLITALHTRWVALWRGVNEADFARTFYHPEHRREIPLDTVAAMYAWHGRHHTAHITGFRERLGGR